MGCPAISSGFFNFNILPAKVKAVAHDNGSNMVAAMRMLIEKRGWASVHCTRHTVQLIVNSDLKETSISRAVDAARSLVEHFRRSRLANTKLKLKQQQMNTAQHKLIQDVSTRWNSTYYMVERLLEQRWPVTATLSDPEITPRAKHCFDLKPDQWMLLEEQEYATASCLLQLMKGLQRSIQQTHFETTPGKAFLVNAGQGITERWGSLNTISSERDNFLGMQLPLTQNSES